MRPARAFVVLLAGAVLGAAACSSPAGNAPATRPADHTLNRGGTYHKQGLTAPLANCVSCQGADLRGGTAGVSCYKCHGQKW